MPQRRRRRVGGESSNKRLFLQSKNIFFRATHSAKFLFLLVILLQITTTAAADSSVGYGPDFDACGDNCQTQLLQFCTQDHNAQQQSDCWCGRGGFDDQYITRMNACLATCSTAVSNINTQRSQILAYRNVVCQGNPNAGGPAFKQFYATRYQGVYTPGATAAAPPPTILVSKLVASSKAHKTSSSTSSPTSSVSITTSSISSSTVATSLSSSTTAASRTSNSSPSSTVPVPSSTTSTTPVESDTTTPTAKKLSNGEIAGISIASLLALSVPLLTIFLLFRRRRQRQLANLPKGKKISPTPDSYFSRQTPSAQGYISTPVDERNADQSLEKQLAAARNAANGDSGDAWTRRMSRRFTSLMGFTPETGSLDLDFELGSEGRLEQFPLPPVPARVPGRGQPKERERPAIHPLYPYRRSPSPGAEARNGSGATNAAVYGSSAGNSNSSGMNSTVVTAAMGAPEEFILPPTPRRLPEDVPSALRPGGRPAAGGIRLVSPERSFSAHSEDIESITSDDGSCCSWSQYGHETEAGAGTGDWTDVGVAMGTPTGTTAPQTASSNAVPGQQGYWRPLTTNGTQGQTYQQGQGYWRRAL